MQKELDNSYWEGKRLQEARESAMKNTIGLLDIAERLGLLKGKYTNLENLFEAYDGAVNQMVDMILKNINLKTDFQKASDYKTEHVGEDDGDEDHCKECGNKFTDGEIRWQVSHPEETEKLCYKCKKNLGLIKG